MGTRTVQGTAAAGYVADIVPDVVAALAEGELGAPDDVEGEVDLMLRLVREFWQMEPDQVMRTCSAFSARCMELHIQLTRAEGRHRAWRTIRTQQVDKLHDELKRQYEIASRKVELRRQDLEQLRTAR
jgi:hypothetical protein